MIENGLSCSFCCVSQNEVEMLVAGKTGNICDACAVLCHEMVIEFFAKRELLEKAALLAESFVDAEFPNVDQSTQAKGIAAAIRGLR